MSTGTFSVEDLNSLFTGTYRFVTSERTHLQIFTGFVSNVLMVDAVGV